MESLTLLELNSLARESLEAGLPGEYWVRAELSEVRVNSSGHCYLEFIQKSERDNRLIAKAKGMIWANTYYLLKAYFERTTGQHLVAGIKVLVKVAVTFHELYGYGLVVSDIDPKYTLGDLAQRRAEILRQLEEEGVLHLNKELAMPLLPQRIAVISSPTAAGFGDFCNQLRDNPYGFFFRVQLFAAVMQGRQVEDSVLNALDRIYERVDDFDAVVIIRGGGASSELSDFDSYLLASACAQFPLPVITGIGHERDDTVLDSVAHVRVKTPTAAAEYLIQQMVDAASLLRTLNERFFKGVKQLVAMKKLELKTISASLPARARKRLAHARVELAERKHRLTRAGSEYLLQQKHLLQLLRQKVEDASPDKLLSRGYSLTLCGGRIVKSVAGLREGDVVDTRVADGRIVSVVRHVESEK